MAGPAREHDRFVRGVDPLIAERLRGLAQPLPRVSQIFRQVLGERRFCRGPAVVGFSFVNPLLAVVALSPGHTQFY